LAHIDPVKPYFKGFTPVFAFYTGAQSLYLGVGDLQSKISGLFSKKTLTRVIGHGKMGAICLYKNYTGLFCFFLLTEEEKSV
tara:strand:- start:11 stop:256 length:246 start_codon:yes stop_codon:yes gene_type:complete